MWSMLESKSKGCRDQDRSELRRNGEPVLVEPQVFDVIVHLLRNRDHLVTKEESSQRRMGAGRGARTLR
jgi:DNA-binding winged helix-turn-helix (wHTH) protein